MKFEAIIFDLDGTAIPGIREGRPSKRLCEVTKKYKDDIKLCTATGRAWVDAKPVIKDLGLTELCIICGGTQIIDPIKEELVWQECIPQETASKLLEISKQFKYKVTSVIGLVENQWVMPEEMVINSDVNGFYILDIPTMSQSEEMIAALAHIKGVTISKAHSWDVEGGIDLHITPEIATKEHAVVELCQRLNINREKVAGVGDGYNDAHLFNSVGYKVAMGNAVPELKEAADIVIGSLDEEGLANFIGETAK